MLYILDTWDEVDRGRASMESGITGIYTMDCFRGIPIGKEQKKLRRSHQGQINNFEHDWTTGTQPHLDIFWGHATSISQDIGTCTKLHCYIVSKSSERRWYIHTKTSLERECYAKFWMIETVNQRLTHDSWTTRRWSWWRQISSKPPHQYHSCSSWYFPPVRDGDYPIVPNIISADNDGTRHAYRATCWLQDSPNVTCWP